MSQRKALQVSFPLPAYVPARRCLVLTYAMLPSGKWILKWESAFEWMTYTQVSCATCLRMCYAIFGTENSYGAMQCPALKCVRYQQLEQHVKETALGLQKLIPAGTSLECPVLPWRINAAKESTGRHCIVFPEQRLGKKGRWLELTMSGSDKVLVVSESKVGICGRNSLEWIVMDYACMWAGSVNYYIVYVGRIS